MKIPAGKADHFLRNMDPAIRAVLIYGPDGGLVRERAEAAAKSVVPDLTDPFLVADLTTETLKADPGRILDEAATIALTGGRRVVRVRDADDGAAAAITAFLDDPVGDALVVVGAGDLAAKSKLRKAFEGSKSVAAAIPCYSDDGQSLDALIRTTMRQAQIRISEDALGYLSAHLGADRALSRGELEKLVLYAGEGGELAIDDIIEATGDSSVYGIDTVIYAAADGDARTVDATLAKMWADGTNAVALLRSMSNHILRLQQVIAERDGGKPVDAAMKSLRPPIFWKMERRFKAQLGLWDKKLSATALDLLLKAEADCKKTGMPDQIICGRALQQTAAIARKRQRR